MLRRGQEVKPHARSGGILAAVEKTNDGFKRVSHAVAPGVADEPRGSCDIVRRCIVAGKLLRHAAAAQRSARPQVPV